MNLFITGGHLTPALAVIDALKRQEKESVRLFFIGREHAQTWPKQPSREQGEVEQRGIPFFAIQAAKIHRERFWLNAIELIKAPVSLFQVIHIFRTFKPDAVLSFGGYVAVPVCMIAKLFGARVITHEQTSSAGLANQFISLFADKVALSHHSSEGYFPKSKIVFTGNPIRESLLRTYKTPPKWLPKELLFRPLIYVTGGSQGSQIINQTVAALIPKLVQKFVVIHQCGPSTGHAYVQELEAVRAQLPVELQPYYVIREWIDAQEVSFLFRTAQFVISRSGANTVLELAIAGTPAIFIPLSFAYKNEQQKNSDALVEAGAALRIEQKHLYPESLYSAIQTMIRKYDAIKAKAVQFQANVKLDGTASLIELLRAS